VGAASSRDSFIFTQPAITLTRTRIVSPVHETRRKYFPVGLRPASLRATVSCTGPTTRILHSAYL
jgi:hypothetical protein